MRKKIFNFRYFLHRIAIAIRTEIRKRKLCKAIEICNTKENFADICETFNYYLQEAGYSGQNLTEINRILENTFDDILDEYFC